MKKTGCFNLSIFLRAFCPLLFAGLILFSCGQDAVFYNISIEPEPKDPIIPGSPTNLVVVSNMVFAGTQQGSDIWFYNGGWGRLSRPGGSIGGLATDGTALYALVFPTGEPMQSSVIKRYHNGIWTESYSAPGYSIQSIYGAGDKIFAGAHYRTNVAPYYSYAILYLNGGILETVKIETSFLKGAAEKSGIGVFLATAGSGILLFDGTAVGPSSVSGTANVNFTGIIETGGIIVATSNENNGSGSIYVSNSTGTLFSPTSSSAIFTGAMCVWKQYEAPVPTATQSVIVNPAVVTVRKNDTWQFDAVVSGLGDPGVTWSVTGASLGTVIDSNGELTIDTDESSTTLTITATSVEDTSLMGTARVFVVEDDNIYGYVTITGNPALGETLVADTSLTALGTPSFQWKRNGVDIPGGTDASYTLTALDHGENISVTVECDGYTGSLSANVTVLVSSGMPWKPALLLLGIRGQGTSTTHGYRELVLDKTTGRPIPGTLRAPGDEPFLSSVTSKPKYTASLGKHPVHAILQVPDISENGPLSYSASIAAYGSTWEPPIFASTSKDGLWVYTYWDDQWNAQD